MCWYCYWGWPKPVVDIYDKWVGIVGESAMEYGPAHSVWGDENFESDDIRWCINQCDNPSPGMEYENVAEVRQSLVELLAVPEEVRCPPGSDEDDCENYPPPVGMEMAKR